MREYRDLNPSVFRNLLMGGVVLKESESNEQCLAVYSSWDSGGSHCLIKNHTSEASYVLWNSCSAYFKLACNQHTQAFALYQLEYSG